MKRSGILALWLILSLVSVVTSGCGYRVAATIQANAEATGAYEALVGGCAGACAFRFRSGNAFRLQTVSAAACHGAFAV